MFSVRLPQPPSSYKIGVEGDLIVCVVAAAALPNLSSGKGASPRIKWNVRTRQPANPQSICPAERQAPGLPCRRPANTAIAQTTVGGGVQAEGLFGLIWHHVGLVGFFPVHVLLVYWLTLDSE